MDFIWTGMKTIGQSCFKTYFSSGIMRLFEKCGCASPKQFLTSSHLLLISEKWDFLHQNRIKFSPVSLESGMKGVSSSGTMSEKSAEDKGVFGRAQMPREKSHSWTISKFFWLRSSKIIVYGTPKCAHVPSENMTHYSGVCHFSFFIGLWRKAAHVVAVDVRKEMSAKINGKTKLWLTTTFFASQFHKFSFSIFFSFVINFRHGHQFVYHLNIWNGEIPSTSSAVCLALKCFMNVEHVALSRSY